MKNGTRMRQVSHSLEWLFILSCGGDFMSYKVVTANGERVFEMKFFQVKDVYVNEGIYYIYDTSNILLFSAPTDSVVYIGLT